MLNVHEHRHFSQAGEDGIIAEIFRRIGTTNRYFVEFGVEEGIECNSLHLSSEGQWRGIVFEGAPSVFERLRRNYAAMPGVAVVREFLTCENIVGLFERYDVPKEPDLLSIDVDGNDYWLWRSLRDYRARLVVIEYNAMYPPPVRWIMKYDVDHRWDNTSYHGASLQALDDLARELGYRLLATTSNGVNAFFLREDLVAASGLPMPSVETAYHAPAFGFFYRHHPHRSGPAIIEHAHAASP